MKLPNSNKAFVDLAKLRDYSLNPEHESGGHKARVFRAALALMIDDAQWLQTEVLRIAQEGEARIGEASQFGQKYIIDRRSLITKGRLLCERLGSSKMEKTFPGS